jgi:hypothetical protein
MEHFVADELSLRGRFGGVPLILDVLADSVELTPQSLDVGRAQMRVDSNLCNCHVSA